jgi:hypothetical protein
LGLAPIEDDGVEQEPGGWPIGAVTTEIERSGWRGVVLVRVRYVREAGMGDKGPGGSRGGSVGGLIECPCAQHLAQRASFQGGQPDVGQDRVLDRPGPLWTPHTSSTSPSRYEHAGPLPT